MTSRGLWLASASSRGLDRLRSEHDKAADEFAAVARFLSLRGLTLVGQMRKGDPHAHVPDILCELSGIGPLAFEMTKACVPDFEFAIMEAVRQYQPVTACWGGGDDVEALLAKKVA